MDDGINTLRAASGELKRMAPVGTMPGIAVPELLLKISAWMEVESQTWAGDEVHYSCTPKSCTREAALEVAHIILTDAYASCPGVERKPNPCRCPCYGCRHNCSAHSPYRFA